MKFGWIICSFIIHDTKVTWAAAALGLVVSIVYFRIFFGSWDDFRDAWSDFWRGLFKRQLGGRISFWVIISVGSAMLAYYQLPEWFPRLFGAIK
jgi:hypothetical protein